MGEAKRRGTREERVALAKVRVTGREKIDAEKLARKMDRHITRQRERDSIKAEHPELTPFYAATDVNPDQVVVVPARTGMSKMGMWLGEGLAMMGLKK